MLSVTSAETQKWFDQNHTSRSTKPISGASAASKRAFTSRWKICCGTASAGRDRRRIAGSLHALPSAMPAALRSSSSLRCAIRRACRSWRKLKTPRSACGGRQQLRIDDLPDARLVQFGEQRAARIGGDRRDRSRARAKAEPMQGQRGRTFRIQGHGRNPQGLPVRDSRRRGSRGSTCGKIAQLARGEQRPPQSNLSIDRYARG